MFTHFSKNTPLVFISFLILAGCQSNPKHAPEVEALIDRTLNNMVFVEGGSFMMGNIGYEVPQTDPEGEWVTMEDGSESYRKPFPGCDDSCFPVHKVTLTGYYINKYEATVGEFDVYTRANKLPLLAENVRPYTDNFEPNKVLSLYLDWYDASDYCQWLGEVTGLPFDLPTEAQWEYAARSRGNAVRFATDNGELEMGRNHSPTFADLIDLDPPGKYPPNPLGLYDMTGNTNEWVRDWYHGLYYEISPELNPTGGPEEELWSYNKVTRGFGRGNFNMQSNLIFRRVTRIPDNDGAATGFRCAIYSDKPIL